MRIALITDPKLFSSDYRSFQPLGELSRRGHRIDVNRVGEAPLQVAGLMQADVVHVHRYADDGARRIVKQLVDAGVAVVWDNDDDITAVPLGTRMAVRGGGLESQRRRTNIERMFGLVDLVTTPSKLLAQHYRESGASDVRIIENYVPEAFLAPRRSAHDGIVVGWTAGGEHVYDLQQLGIRETLERLLATHSDVRVASIGVNLGISSDRYRHVEAVPFLRLCEQVSTFDIGIAPLADVPFNRARSNIKLKEYAAAGIPWLASPVGPYLGLGEQQGGRLVPDGSWYEALERLVVHERERRKLAKRAAKWAKGESIRRNVHRWEDALQDALVHAQSRSRVRS